MSLMSTLGYLIADNDAFKKTARTGRVGHRVSNERHRAGIYLLQCAHLARDTEVP